MLVATGKIHHLRHFGFGDFIRIHAHNGEPLLMYRQHDVEGLRMVQAKEPLKNVNNEFHRRVIIVQQHDLEHRRTLGARLGLGHKTGIRTVSRSVFVVRQSKGLQRQDGLVVQDSQMRV